MKTVGAPHSNPSARASYALAQVTHRSAARLALVSASLFLALLASLHVIKPEYEPSWRLISEYSIGRFGWVMVLAFLSLALSCVSLALAIRSSVNTRAGNIGLFFLLLSATGMIIAAIFKADPITATQAQLTTHGTLHGLGGLLGIPGFPVAALLISLSLRRNPAWRSAKRPLLLTTSLIWFSLLAFVAVILATFEGAFGSAVPVGWPNRFMMLANSTWLMAAAWHALKVGTPVSPTAR